MRQTYELSHLPGFLLGAPGGIRTPDPRIRSPTLYPLSYGRKTLLVQVRGLNTRSSRSLTGPPIYPMTPPRLGEDDLDGEAPELAHDFGRQVG